LGVHKRFLAVLAVTAFVLTLLFAVAAGAQDTTTSDTTTSTADAAREATTANNNASGARGADSFRCEFFLRSVSDERGALLGQYRGNELIVQRFEQCLSGGVLVDTIPDRKLPFTGGMPLLGLAAVGLVSLIAGAAALRAVMRRAR
jgi:hypothetical protein